MGGLINFLCWNKTIMKIQDTKLLQTTTMLKTRSEEIDHPIAKEMLRWMALCYENYIFGDLLEYWIDDSFGGITIYLEESNPNLEDLIIANIELKDPSQTDYDLFEILKKKHGHAIGVDSSYSLNDSIIGVLVAYEKQGLNFSKPFVAQWTEMLKIGSEMFEDKKDFEFYLASKEKGDKVIVTVFGMSKEYGIMESSLSF